MAKTLHRIAAVHEMQAIVAVSRAEAERVSAEDAVMAVEQLDRAAEETLAGDGQLSGADRELLWAHRTWVRTERETTAERLAMTELQVARSKDAHTLRKRDLFRTETVRDRVLHQEYAVREGKAQRESDELSTMRWNQQHS